MASRALSLNSKRVAQNFGAAADSYDQHAALQRQLSEQLRQHWPILAAGDSVLDLGCGTGVDSLWLQQQLLNVHAIDLSAGMLAAAQARCGEQLKTHNLDVAAVGSLGIQADAIWSCSMLQWADDLPLAMREIYGALKPGGEFWGCLFTDGSLAELANAWKAVDDQPHLSELPTQTASQSALLGAGFNVHWQQAVNTQLHFTDLAAIRDHLRGLGATNANQQRSKGLMSKSALQKLTQALEQYRQPDGIPLTWNAWMFGARKP